MFYKNLTCFRFPEGVVDANKLCADMPGLREIGALELKCHGFVDSPVTGELLSSVGEFHAFRIGVTEKVLPPAVLREALAKRVEASEEESGGKVGPKERKRLKDEILTELVAKAFSQTRYVNAYMHIESGWLVVDTGTRSVAELVVSMVREALGSFPCTPLTPEESPKVLMTHWLANEGTDPPFGLGDECELRESAEKGAKWSGRGCDLEADEVGEHIKAGLQVQRMGLSTDRLSFVLDIDLVIRKLKFRDCVVKKVEGEDSAAIALSEFTLMTLELQQLLEALTQVFNIPRGPALRMDGGDAAPEMKAEKPLRVDSMVGADHFEKGVRLAAALYEARDTAKVFWGDRYAGEMSKLCNLIQGYAKQHSLSDLDAAHALAKENEFNVAGGMILAAYVELVEPSKERMPKPTRGVRNALKKLVGGIKGDTKMTISGMSDGKVTSSVTIDSNAARRIRNNVDRLNAMEKDK